MKPTYCAVFAHPNKNLKQFNALSESQLIKTMLEQGIQSVSSITHEEGSGAVGPVEGKELISIWKQVYRTILHRKH